MKLKTSLSLDNVVAATAREHASRADMTLSTWVERAIRDLAATEDLVIYEQWRDSWSEEDKANEAALDALDRAGLPE